MNPNQIQTRTPTTDADRFNAQPWSVAQVLALLWIGYELHELANTEPAADEPESTVSPVPSSALRG